MRDTSDAQFSRSGQSAGYWRAPADSLERHLRYPGGHDYLMAKDGSGGTRNHAISAAARLRRPAKWAIALVLTALAVAISYEWLDRPIAHFMHAHFHNEPLFTRLTLIPEFFAPLAVLAFIVLGLRALLE